MKTKMPTAIYGRLKTTDNPKQGKSAVQTAYPPFPLLGKTATAKKKPLRGRLKARLTAHPPLPIQIKPFQTAATCAAPNTYHPNWSNGSPKRAAKGCFTDSANSAPHWTECLGTRRSKCRATASTSCTNTASPTPSCGRNGRPLSAGPTKARPIQTKVFQTAPMPQYCPKSSKPGWKHGLNRAAATACWNTANKFLPCSTKCLWAAAKKHRICVPPSCAGTTFTTRCCG